MKKSDRSAHRLRRILCGLLLVLLPAGCLKSDTVAVEDLFNATLFRELLSARATIVVMVDNGWTIWFSRDVANLTVDSWDAIPISVTTPNFTDVVFGNGMFVAILSTTDQIYSSPDGVNWTLTTVPGAASLTHIAYGNGLFVAVGTSGMVRYSADGAEWFQSSISSMAGNPDDIAYGNGLFVVLEDGATNNVYTSPDGNDWNLSASVSNINKLAFDGSRFLATQSGTATPPVDSSINGIDWSAVPSTIPAASGIDILRFGGGSFQAVGNGEAYLSSDGGNNWDTGSMSTGTVYDLIQINDFMVAVGCDGACTNGFVWFSDDGGYQWSDATPAGAGSIIAGIAAGN